MAVKEHTSSFDPKPFGRYVLVDKLAIGGMAEIYKAKTYGVDGFEKLRRGRHEPDAFVP